MSLRTHLAAEVTAPATGGAQVRTACNRRGFKDRASNVDGEWEAMAQIGGLIALNARRFDAFMAGPQARDACARCRAAWEDGADGAD